MRYLPAIMLCRKTHGGGRPTTASLVSLEHENKARIRGRVGVKGSKGQRGLAFRIWELPALCALPPFGEQAKHVSGLAHVGVDVGGTPKQTAAAHRCRQCLVTCYSVVSAWLHAIAPMALRLLGKGSMR